jgi:hypothetical protein
MLYALILWHIVSFGLSSNYHYLENKSFENHIFGIQLAGQYREDRESNLTASIDYMGKNINDVFRLKYSFITTSERSNIISFGTSKEIFLNKNFFISTHLMPSFGYFKNKDLNNATSGLKFNIAFEMGIFVSKNYQLSLEWRHLSSNYTTMPNTAIDTLGIKLRFAF